MTAHRYLRPRKIDSIHLEARLLAFALLIVFLGMTATYFGKISSVAQLDPGSLNVNLANASELSDTLGISRSSAIALVDYRQSLPGGQFASVFRLRRAPSLKNSDLVWNWDQLYVRSPLSVAEAYFGALLAFLIAFMLLHIVLRQRAPAADPFLLPIVTILSGFGLMVALTVHDPLRDTFAFANQAIGVICFGTLAFVVPLLSGFQRLPLHRYTYAYAFAAVLLLTVLFIFGRGPAGTHIQLLGFEPIEVIKVLLIFFIAAYLADRRMSLQQDLVKHDILPIWRDLLPLLAIYAFALSLFGAVKDMGPAVLLFGSFVALLYLVSGRPIYPLLGVILLLAAGYAGDKLGIGFFATRVQMWLHPWHNSNRLGGQLAQGLWGLSTGGIFGSGAGLGGSYFVPRAGSDMAFTTIGEEYGLVGGLCLLVLYSSVIFRGFQIAKAGLDDFDRLLAAGITILIGLQAVVIAGGATGLLPLTGITLPFVSYGTSSLMANFFCIGVLLSLSSKPANSLLKSGDSKLFNRCARRVALALVGSLLLLVGVYRLMWVQGLDDNDYATRSLTIPDADKIYRVHRNPRLLAYAEQIPRGCIRDRNGLLLAGNAPVGQGVPYLTDGIARYYPRGNVASNLIYAVEQSSSPSNPLGSDEILRGYSELNSLLPFYQSKDFLVPPVLYGEDVKLSIDLNLQRAAQSALESETVKYGDHRGAVVVLDVTTGKLLAAATVPTFDPNELTGEYWDYIHRSLDQNNPLINRAFSGVYVPGSVFKLVTATAAMQQNKSNLTFSCTHILRKISWKYDGVDYFRRNITDDEEFAPHGFTDLSKAIRVSCNVYFAQLGVAIGPLPLENAIQSYGLHECPGSRQIAADLPDCAYGQGTDLVTPYQMAHVVQAIANDGYAGPSLMTISEDNPGGLRVLRKSDAQALQKMMKGVVMNGTAAGAFPGLDVAGKTGSAQVSDGPPHSWFVGFTPTTRPSIAFACIVEHGGHGRGAAASVCEKIIRSYIR